MQYLTAPQLIYLGAGNPLKIKPGVCRLCGGLMLEGDVEDVSDSSWTDENLSRRLDAGEHCAACRWVRKNRGLWGKPEFGKLIPDPELKTPKTSYTVLLGKPSGNIFYQSRWQVLAAMEEALKDLPNVIIMRYGSMAESQRHICFRAIGHENYDPNNIKVTIYSPNKTHYVEHLEFRAEDIPRLKEDFGRFDTWYNANRPTKEERREFMQRFKSLAGNHYAVFLYNLALGRGKK